MKRNLLYQGRKLLGTSLMTLGGLVAYVVFVGVFMGTSPNRNGYTTIRLGMLYVVAVYCVMFLAGFFGNQVVQAVKFGATRRQWFLASLLTRLGFAVVVALGVSLVVEPLGSWMLTGQLEWSLMIQPAWLPLLTSAIYLLASLGCLFGYLTLRFSKWGILFTILLILLLGVLVFVVGDWLTGHDLLNAWQSMSPVLVLLPLAVCLIPEGLSWLLLRNLAVKG